MVRDSSLVEAEAGESDYNLQRQPASLFAEQWWRKEAVSEAVTSRGTSWIDLA